AFIDDVELMPGHFRVKANSGRAPLFVSEDLQAVAIVTDDVLSMDRSRTEDQPHIDVEAAPDRILSISQLQRRALAGAFDHHEPADHGSLHGIPAFRDTRALRSRSTGGFVFVAA